MYPSERVVLPLAHERQARERELAALERRGLRIVCIFLRNRARLGH